MLTELYLEPSMLELCSQASFSDAHKTKSIPVIAANLHRVMKPCQEQIWAVLRKSDDEDRLNYTLASTFLGRMCLSGDIYDLSEKQWETVENAVGFYKKAAEIIKNGHTVYIGNNVRTNTKPEGQQIVITEYDGRQLIVAHRFENSEDINTGFLNGVKIIEMFGRADKDFTAQAWITEQIREGKKRGRRRRCIKPLRLKKRLYNGVLCREPCKNQSNSARAA